MENNIRSAVGFALGNMSNPQISSGFQSPRPLNSAKTIRIAINGGSGKPFPLKVLRIGGSVVFLNLAQTELEQMLRLIFAAGPAVSLFKFNSKEIIDPVQFAVPYTGLTVIAGKLEVHDGFGRNWLFDFETRTRSGDIFEYCPLAVSGAGWSFPLDFDEIGAKLPFLMTPWSHDYFIGKSTQLFTLHFSTVICGKGRPGPVGVARAAVVRSA